jgi:hypothetical protein
MCQMGEPVKPGTTLTPKAAAARAVFFVAPKTRRQNGRVAFVDAVAHGLADQMVADSKALQPMSVQNVPARLEVTILFERLVYLEVIAPAGDFHTVVAKVLGFGAQGIKSEIRPLAAE